LTGFFETVTAHRRRLSHRRRPPGPGHSAWRRRTSPDVRPEAGAGTSEGAWPLLAVTLQIIGPELELDSGPGAAASGGGRTDRRERHLPVVVLV